MPGFEASVCHALLLPAGTPPAIITRLNAATNDYLKSEQAKEIFANLGIETAAGRGRSSILSSPPGSPNGDRS